MEYAKLDRLANNLQLATALTKFVRCTATEHQQEDMNRLVEVLESCRKAANSMRITRIYPGS